MLSPSLQPLENYSHFILYKLAPSKSRPGKTDKLPINPTTLAISNAHDRVIQKDYAFCRDRLNSLSPMDYGIGFVFTKDDPFFFLDIDNCYDSGWSQLASELCTTLQGCAVEISQSKTGLHIIGQYTGDLAHSCKDTSNGLELYTQDRFIALTDDSTQGSANYDATLMLDSVIIPTYFPANKSILSSGDEWSSVAVDEWAGPEDNTELINRALRAKSAAQAFGNKSSFKDLWENNEAILAQFYPVLNDVDPYDRSSADAALAQHLAFWTGKNHQRIMDLMWLSALKRDKWTSHKSYLTRTITNAVAYQRGVYQERGSQGENLSPEAEMTAGAQFLTVNNQMEFFKGCVYVQHHNKILTPQGVLLDQSRFKPTYGGYVFCLDNENQKTTRNPWEAFTENQGVRFPKVYNVCFRPELQFGEIMDIEGKSMVNTYKPITTKKTKGSPDMWVDYFHRLLPNRIDREIMLAYMAGCVQYPGHKFKYAPVIQGVEGNGKSLIIGKVLEHAVGLTYTHRLSAQDLAGNGLKYNGWMIDKLLIVIEEVFTQEKLTIIEGLKPYVSDDRLEIQPKGVNQYTGDNRANFIMFTNFKNAMKITADSRRYTIIFSGQQSLRDLEIQQMHGKQYFLKLVDWLKNKDGYYIMNNYLSQYNIPQEFNPIYMERAPKTEHFSEAVELSRSNVHQEIQEAVDGGKQGFCFPWISSAMLDELLRELGIIRYVPRNKRKDILKELGYIQHPGLKNGRCNNTIIHENAKPVLYIKEGHIHAQLKLPPEIVNKYNDAQNYKPFKSPSNLKLGATR